MKFEERWIEAASNAQPALPNRTPGRLPLANTTQQEQLTVLHVQSVRRIRPSPNPHKQPIHERKLRSPGSPHASGLLHPRRCSG